MLEAMRRSAAAMFGPDAAVWAAAVRAESVAVAMAVAPEGEAGDRVAGLSEQDMAVERRCVVEGMSGSEAGAALFVDKSTVLSRMRGVERSLGVTRPGDWAPVLDLLVQSGRLTAADAGMAVGHLTGRGEPGPARVWEGLLGRLEAGGVAAEDVGVLRWQAACGGLGLRGVERDLLRAMARGDEKAEVDKTFGRNNLLRQSLAGKLGGFESRAGQDLTTPIVAAAAFLGVLPPDHDGRTVALARVQTHAAAVGHAVTAGQAGLLLDVAGGMPLAEITERYGSGLGLMAMKLWTALAVPGKWDQGRNTAALVGRAAELGLLDAGVLARAAPAGLVDPRTVEAPAPEPVVAAERAALRAGAIPSVQYGAETLERAEIIAAPSIPDAELETYRLWQVRHVPQGDCPGAGPAGANISYYRRQLADRLGEPDARGFLAITARAVAEGKLDGADLLEAQRWAGAERLGLRRDDIRALVALANGCTPMEVATVLEATVPNTRSRLKQIGERLGVAGSATEIGVRQAMLDVAFRHGMFADRPVVPETGPAEIAPARQVRGRGRTPEISVSFAWEPISAEEIGGGSVRHAGDPGAVQGLEGGQSGDDRVGGGRARGRGQCEGCGREVAGRPRCAGISGDCGEGGAGGASDDGGAIPGRALGGGGVGWADAEGLGGSGCGGAEPEP